MRTGDEIYYYWSARRRGWVVYALGLLQSTSYATEALLMEDWPTAKPSGVTPEVVAIAAETTATKARLPYWLGGLRANG